MQSLEKRDSETEDSGIRGLEKRDPEAEDPGIRGLEKRDSETEDPGIQGLEKRDSETEDSGIRGSSAQKENVSAKQDLTAQKKDKSAAFSVNVHVSVRELVEFILRSGDIDNRRGGPADKEAMLEGGRLHRRIQGRMGSSYKAEVPLSAAVSFEGFTLTVEGRADGIIMEDDVYIDEIKGVYRDLRRIEEPVPVHLAQAKCYAHIYASSHGLAQIGVQMTYSSLVNGDVKRFRQMYEAEELSEWFAGLTSEYEKWVRYQIEWKKIRQASCREAEFPFPWRQGQKKLAQDVYRTILRQKKLFIQAPTGTGKTLSAVFPAVKAVGEEIADRIFYMTAKTITRTVAENAFDMLRKRGLRMKVLTLTAKERICFCEETECNPDYCPYARGHFDRVNDAVYDMITGTDVFDRDAVVRQAQKWMVCPFEFSLDVSLWVDAVICDYNYVFHPRAKLKRFFAEETKGDYLFLIDEAHNLVDRGRAMFSAELYKEDFLELKKMVRPYNTRLVNALETCNRDLLRLKKEMEKESSEAKEKKKPEERVSEAEERKKPKERISEAEGKKKPEESISEAEGGKKSEKCISEAEGKKKPEKCISEAEEEKKSGECISEAEGKKKPGECISEAEGKKKSEKSMSAAEDTVEIKAAPILIQAAGRNTCRIQEEVGIFPVHLMNLCGVIEDYLEELRQGKRPALEYARVHKKVLDFYFQVLAFLDACDRLGNDYVIYTELGEDKRFMIKLYCVDISRNLQECLDKGKSTVYFSATLLPVNYYKNLLSTVKDDYAVYAQSSFDPRKQKVLIGADTSSRFTNRSEAEYRKMAQYVLEMVRAKQGNYMVFFPSYRMLGDVADAFAELCGMEEICLSENCGKEGRKECGKKTAEIGQEEGNRWIELLRQKPGMNEKEREQFLEQFRSDREGSLVGFCVMGGIFGEGIDLKHDRLIGAAVIGTGLPQVCNEREILRKFYDDRGEDGFFYAYLCPGMNKVLQSAGRVIRTDEDKGVILLLDERFSKTRCRQMFPEEWRRPQICTIKNVREKLREFWEK